MTSNNWDLSKIYSDDSLVKEDIIKVKNYLDNLDEYLEDPKGNLLNILKLNEDTARTLSKLGAYANMKRDEDSRVSAYQKMTLEIGTLGAQVGAAFSFINPLIFSLSDREVEEILNSEDYAHYKNHLEKILRYKAHTLSEEEETILSKVSELNQMPGNAYYMLTNADMEFPFIESANEKLTSANYIKMLTNSDETIRKEAFDKYYGTYEKLMNTIGSTLYGNMKALVIQSQIKGYASSREMELYEDDVPVEVYDNLIDIVHEYLPYLHKYYEIKEKALGLKETHMYDVYLSISENSNENIPFEEARDMVLEAVAPLGEEYQRNMRRAFEENWIDVYPREGKRSGAYSGGHHDHDPYILLNYNGTLDSVFTLIHELGHSMHSYYSRKNNAFLYSRYTIFAAEVASTFNELLLLDYLIGKAETREEKIRLLDHHIDSFKSTVFRQTMFAEFERETHKLIETGAALTHEDFSKIYYDLNVKYFGEKVISDDAIKMEWARIPHFYRDYYVYKYATGFSAATVLSSRVLKGEENALENYGEFLKDGNKHFPIEQLKSAGADMSNPEVLREAFEVFKEKVLELEAIYE